MKVATPRRSMRLSAVAVPLAEARPAASPATQAIAGRLLGAQQAFMAPPPFTSGAQVKGQYLPLTRPLVAWDLEAQPRHGQQGLDLHHDRILEFGAIKRFADSRPDESRRLRFRVPFFVPPRVLLGHGIALRDYMAAPPFADKADEIRAFLDGCDFVGHYTKRFDIPLLGAALGRACGKTWGVDFHWPPLGTRVLDTWELFRRFVPDKQQAGGDYKLGTCVRFYTGKPLLEAHSALADAQGCMDVTHAMASACATGIAVGLSGPTGYTTVADLDALATAARTTSHASTATAAFFVLAADAKNEDMERGHHAACRP